jgi:hypothetical protein
MGDGGFGFDDDTKFKSVRQEMATALPSGIQTAGDMAQFGANEPDRRFGSREVTSMAGKPQGTGGNPTQPAPVVGNQPAPTAPPQALAGSPAAPPPSLAAPAPTYSTGVSVVDNALGSALSDKSGYGVLRDRTTAPSTYGARSMARLGVSDKYLPGYRDGKKALRCADGASMKNGVHMPGMVEGPGTGTSDSVGPARLPESGERAMLSKGEAVIPADTVGEMNEDFFGGDPKGVEKYVLVNHEPVGNKSDWNRRIEKVGGPEALRQFAVQNGEESPEGPEQYKNGKRCADGLRFYQEGRPITQMDKDAVDTITGRNSTQEVQARNVDAAEQAALGTGGVDMATTQTVQQAPAVESAANALVNPDLAPKTAADAVAAQKEVNDAALKSQAEYEVNMAKYKAAVEAAKNTKKVTEEQDTGFFGFADGKGLRHYADSNIPFHYRNVEDALQTAAKTAAPVVEQAAPTAGRLRTAVNAVKSSPIKSALLKGGAIGALAEGAFAGAKTPTSAYYERFGLDPSTEGLSTAKDVAVRAGGYTSDVLNAATLKLPETLGLFEDKNHAPVVEAPAAAQSPAGLRSMPQAGQTSGNIVQTGKNSFSGIGTPDSATEIAAQQNRRIVADAMNDNKSRSEEWIRRNPHRYLQNQQIVADANAKETAAAQAQYGVMKDMAAAQERAGDRESKYGETVQTLLKDAPDKEEINRVTAMYPQLNSGVAHTDVENARKVADFLKRYKTKDGRMPTFDQLPSLLDAQNVGAESGFFNTADEAGWGTALRGLVPGSGFNMAPGGGVVARSEQRDPALSAILRQYGN